LFPFLSYVRFPRFYTLAIMGLSLSAAFPIVVLERRLRHREPRLTPLLSAAVALAIAGVFLVDIHPYRSFYRSGPPESAEAYARFREDIADRPGGSRVGITQFGAAPVVDALTRDGVEVSMGWPHPVASKDVWKLTAEVVLTPVDYRNRALALSATSYLATEKLSEGKDRQLFVTDVEAERIPEVLDRVRAYEQVVVTQDEPLGVELAIALSQRGIGVVSGSSSTARTMGEGRTVLDQGLRCEGPNIPAAAAGLPMAAEAAMGCALHDRVRLDETGELDVIDISPEGTGAIFDAPLKDLRGIAIWVGGGAASAELTLYELAPDGRSRGQEVRRSISSGTDANGLETFNFDPVADSGGKRYLFLVRCDRCSSAEEQPKMFIARGRERPADVVDRGRILPDTTAAFSPMYERVPEADPPSTTVRAVQTIPGRWRIETSGSRPALIVVADAKFPGWVARVDDERVEVVKADGAFLGVPVGPGEHTIDLEFHKPPSAFVGRAITGLTILFGAFLLLPARQNAQLKRGLARSRARVRRTADAD
ncbi:MAG: YfhO family protein, partial [Actinobacteria bacterium]|nr:YfhO family protein [Actinomycetota bacterium]